MLENHGNLVDLNSHTFLNGKKFPRSYISFVEEYGYGLSCDSFIIYIPMDEYGDSWEIQNEIFKERFIDVLSWGDPEDLKEDILYPDGSIELLKSAEPFGKSENGEYLFWDPNNGSNDELDIYITDFGGLGFTKVANNLYDFFRKITSQTDYKKVLPFSENPLPNTFKPLNRIS